MSILNKVRSKSINDVLNHYKNKSQNRKNLKERDKICQEYFKSGSSFKLQLGCGHCPLPGWLNSDLANNEKVIYLDAGDAYPFNDNTFNFIFCEHLFEHLTFNQEMTLLKESYRTLKPGGVLRIAMPNLEFLLKLNTNSELSRRYITHATQNLWNLKGVKSVFDESEYSEVFVVSNFFKDWGHQIIHNNDSISKMLRKVGFNSINFKNIGESDYPELRGIEQHGKIIGDEFNQLETFIVEATK